MGLAELIELADEEKYKESSQEKKKKKCNRGQPIQFSALQALSWGFITLISPFPFF